MLEKKEKAKLLEDATLADFVERYEGLSLANAGAGKLADELAYQIFDYFKREENANMKCSDVWRCAEAAADNLYRKYLIISREEFSKK